MHAGLPACATAHLPPAAAASFTRSTTMLKTGKEHLESLRDGRVVYIGSEKVDDVTAHPAFRNGARSIAALYDLKSGHFFEEKGERFSNCFLKAKTREDLE